MPEYWWVNHKQTARQEIEGQYLWSPKKKSDGRSSQFYDNMPSANPGDLVLSYANQEIRYVGRVTEFAFTAPKPPEFGTIGINWNHEGWYLPVYWTPLHPPIRPKQLIDRLGPLLPERYSPISPVTGAGYQGVYLTAIPQTVLEVVVTSTTFDRHTLAYGGQNSLTFESVRERLDDLVEAHILTDLQLEDTIRDSVIQARRGQGRFRANVEAVESSCRLTGITNPSLLIASHIKPWRLCSSAEERLDGMNGLLLTPDADLLFDRGFICFENDGEVRVSSRVDRFDLHRLGFERLAQERFGFAEAPAVWRTAGFEAQRHDYLAYHRENVFIA